MWWIIPLVFLVLTIIFLFIAQRRYSLGFICFLFGALFFFALIICSANYYHGLERAIENEQYYDSFIIPNKISEDATTVTVSGQVPGIWQAGSAVSYNSYLANYRYWMKVPVINTVTYPVPERLKFVIVK
jgi:hypothetical protein